MSDSIPSKPIRTAKIKATEINKHLLDNSIATANRGVKRTTASKDSSKPSSSEALNQQPAKKVIKQTHSLDDLGIRLKSNDIEVEPIKTKKGAVIRKKATIKETDKGKLISTIIIF